MDAEHAGALPVGEHVGRDGGRDAILGRTAGDMPEESLA